MSFKGFELGVRFHCDPSKFSLLFKTFDLLIQLFAGFYHAVYIIYNMTHGLWATD